MSFVSVAFLVFLPLVFLLYWALQRHLRCQNIALLTASYVFYAWWDWRFLFLILITSASSFTSGLIMPKTSHKRWVLTACVLLNLGILGVFKYYGFFIDNLQAMLAPLGIALDAPTLHLILPVGISFYTFQSLSYAIDVYRGTLTPTRGMGTLQRLSAAPLASGTSALHTPHLPAGSCRMGRLPFCQYDRGSRLSLDARLSALYPSSGLHRSW